MRSMGVLQAAAAVLLISAGTAPDTASANLDEGIAPDQWSIRPLQPGDPVPDFSVRQVDGGEWRFAADAGGPVLFIAFRGGWCPYCNLHLGELRDVLPAIDALGVDVVFLSGDRPEILYSGLRDARHAAETLEYTVLSDADMQAAIAFGTAFRIPGSVLERRYAKGDDIGQSSMLRHGALTVPAVFAVDADGVVRFSYANPDYKVRLPAGELLGVAERLAGAGSPIADDSGSAKTGAKTGSAEAGSGG